MNTAQEAYQSGRNNAHTAPLHDLTGHMARLAVPAKFHGQWLAGLEDALQDDGFDVEGEIEKESDGYGWERKALAGI